MISLPVGHVRDAGIARGAGRRLWCVILAAGGARRFGRNKLAARAGRKGLLELAVDRAMAVTGRHCVVVLGANAGRARAALAGRPVRFVLNRQWRHGMAGSLRTGVAALPHNATAALIVLPDQFSVTTADLLELAGAWRGHPGRPAAACVDGRPGAPAILPRSLFGAVSGLRGDQGARGLLRSGAMPVTAVNMPSAAVDLDVPADLPAMRRALRGHPGVGMARAMRPSQSTPRGSAPYWCCPSHASRDTQ